MSKLSLSVVPVVRSLDDIAESIRAHWSATEEDRFAIGRDLVEARERFPGDTEFGQWFATQRFPFARSWAHTLRLAAEHEPAVRAALSTQVDSGKPSNIKKAVRAVLHPASDEPIATSEARKEKHQKTNLTETRANIRSVQLSLARINPLDVVADAKPVVREFALWLIEWANQWSDSDAEGVQVRPKESDERQHISGPDDLPRSDQGAGRISA